MVYRRTAFTLVELLVSLAVVAILFAILVPSIVTIRHEARRATCLANTRSIGWAMTSYATTFGGSFPACVSDAEAANDPQLASRYSQQIWSVLESPPWEEHIGISSAAQFARCPSNHKSRITGGVARGYDYILSASIYADPTYFAADLSRPQWEGRLGARVQRDDAVVFPALKAGIFEFDVWHAWNGVYGYDDLTTLNYRYALGPGSVYFFDGHARSMHARDALPHVDRWPIWPDMPFGSTVDGVRGRDRR